MGVAEIEIAFERIKEIYDEETNWQLFYLKHMDDTDCTKREMMESRLDNLRKERDSLIKSISMEK